MKNHKESFLIPIAFVLVLLLVQLLIDDNLKHQLGVLPYHFSGLKGVLFMPLLHGSWEHLFSNSVPLAVLLFLSFQFYGKLTYWVVIIGWLSTGLMVWMFPSLNISEYSSTPHIGASAVVYVLAFFLMFSGFFKHQRTLIVLSLIVVVSYGSMIWGIFPEEALGKKESNVSWQGHLSGAIVGTILSYIFRDKTQVEDKKFEWEGKKELSDQDQALWDRYIAINEQHVFNQIEITPKDIQKITKIDEYYNPKNSDYS